MSFFEISKRYIGVVNLEIKHSIWPMRTYFLHHPLATSRKVLSSVLPEGMNLDEVIEKTHIQQKILSKRVTKSSLPADRPPGYIGQIALFEAIRNSGFDFSYIFRKNLYEWDTSGFSLLYHLLRFHYIVSFLNQQDVDISEVFLESKYHTLQELWYDQLWMERIYTSADYLKRQLRVLNSQYIKSFFRNASQVADQRKLTPRRIQMWCGGTRKQAQPITNVLHALRYSTGYRFVPKNLGVVWSLEFNERNPAPHTDVLMRCIDLESHDSVFMRYNLDYPESVDGLTSSKELFSFNVTLYDDKASKWKLSLNESNITDWESLKEIAMIPENAVKTSGFVANPRDLYVTGIMRIFTDEELVQLGVSPEGLLVHFFGMDAGDAKLGLRSVFRNGLLVSQSNISWLLGIAKVYMIVTCDDYRRTIPYLASLLQSTPRAGFRTNEEMNNLTGWVNIPIYLAKEFLSIEREIKDSFGVERKIFEVQQFKYYSSSALLALLQELQG